MMEDRDKWASRDANEVREYYQAEVERLQTLLNGFCPHCNAHLPTYGGPRALAEEKE